MRPPRWLAPVSLLLAVIGVGVASYLTVEHFSGSAHLAGCAAGGTVDCGKVTTSKWSHFLGMPVALLGLLYFLGALPFLLPAAWRSRNRLVRWGRQAGALLGLGFVIWLLYAELVKVQHICEYCTSVHVITLILFVVITYGTIVTSGVPLGLADDEDSDDDAGDSEAAPAGNALA